MNTPKAIEIAVGSVLRAFASVGPKTVIRMWQSLKRDTLWKVNAETNSDYVTPCIDVRCSPPQTDSSQLTELYSCQIAVLVDADKDRDHAIVSAMYEGISETCERMRQAYVLGNESEARRVALQTSLAADVPAITVGGITYGSPLDPQDTDTPQGPRLAIGLTLVFHIGIKTTY